MKDIFMREKNKELDIRFMKMVTFTLENFKKIKNMDTVQCIGLIFQQLNHMNIMMVNGGQVSHKEQAIINEEMVYLKFI